MSVISLMEILEGLSRNQDATQTRFDSMLEFINMHPATRETATIAADIRRHIRASKAPVRERALDILIAATAIEHDLLLVTRNIRHFQDIEELRILGTDLA